jgi:hypothetical protein
MAFIIAGSWSQRPERWTGTRSLFAQRQAILSTENGHPSRQSLEMVPTIGCGQMKKVGLADQRTSNGLPSASDPETEADRAPRGSSLAVMTANVSHV